MTTVERREDSPPPMSLVGRLLVTGLLVAGLVVASVDPFTAFFFATYAALGALLVVRRPRNTIGWLALAIAFAFNGTSVRGGHDTALLASGRAPLDQFLSAWFASWAGMLAFALIVALAVVFPAGRLPEERPLRGLGALLLGAGVIVVGLAVFSPSISFSPDGVTNVEFPNRFGLLGWLPIWDVLTPDALFAPIVPLLVVAVILIALRYRRANGVLRLQLRWLVASVTFVVLSVIVGLSSVALLPEDPGVLAWIPAIIAYPTIPISIAVAVLRYRLYDIDRIVSRSVSWALVSATLVAAFATAVLVLQALLAGITQGQTLAVAASTLLAFALFQPVRRRVQGAVDRRFDRARYDAQHTADRFAERVRNEVDLLTLRLALVTTADQSVRPNTAGVWLRSGSGGDR